MARRLNVDQALKGAGQLPGSGLAPLTVPQSTQHGKLTCPEYRKSEQQRCDFKSVAMPDFTIAM